MRIFIGISGASGTVYGGRLIEILAAQDHELTVCLSHAALTVLAVEELASSPDDGRVSKEEIAARFFNIHGIDPGLLELVWPDEISNAFASGSYRADTAIVCPCSMSSLASIASGVTRNLIHRVADVMLKESRPLLLVPRETPLNQIHLGNMLTLSRAGARIIPAMPAFYHHPETIEDMVDFVVGKVLDAMAIEHNLFQRWGERTEDRS